MMETIRWNGDSVTMLDQRLLPLEETYHTYHQFHDVVISIKEMEIRGAPAIGIAAAMGIALAARNILENGGKFQEDMKRALDAFAAARPTAVNLVWAVNRMRAIVESGTDPRDVAARLEKEAVAVFDEDLAANKAMGAHGAMLIAGGDTVMTHCNAGALATAGFGTALGVIRAAVAEGKKIQVFACETRPLLQGARLTAWELLKDGIAVTLITDNMAGHFMKTGAIQKVVVGADRIAANGDTANKIGTYGHSVLAREHGIPFYIAAPISTIDAGTKTGADIVIEERGVDEVAYVRGQQIAPEGVFIRNPAFDVTPVGNITAIVTERGVIEKPDASKIAEHLKR